VTPQRAPETPRAVSPGTYKRLTSGPGQFGLAMGACLLLVLIVVLISPGQSIITPHGTKQILPSADPNQAATALQYSAPYRSWAPQGLPHGWQCTSSRLSGNGGSVIGWHAGYVTPKGEYASLEESNEQPADGFVHRMTNIDPAKPNTLRGTVQIAGATWQQYYRADKKQSSLVRRLPGVTLVVTGTASYSELAVLAASLHPQPQHTTPTPTKPA
jgi:hypothetical protein